MLLVNKWPAIFKRVSGRVQLSMARRKLEQFSVDNSLSKWFEPSCVSSSYSVIVWVKVILKRPVLVVGDLCLDNLL